MWNVLVIKAKQIYLGSSRQDVISCFKAFVLSVLLPRRYIAIMRFASQILECFELTFALILQVQFLNNVFFTQYVSYAYSSILSLLVPSHKLSRETPNNLSCLDVV
jgi:hypothetical protein